MTNLDHDTAKELIEDLIMTAMHELQQEHGLKRGKHHPLYLQLEDLFDNWDVMPVEQEDDDPFDQHEFNRRVADDIGRLQGELQDLKHNLRATSGRTMDHDVTLKEIDKRVWVCEGWQVLNTGRPDDWNPNDDNTD